MTPPSAHAATAGSAQVFRFNNKQWRDAMNKRLEELGLTYEELAEQAERKNFVSAAARKLWYLIGGSL